jgi:hypothetical protein
MDILNGLGNGVTVRLAHAREGEESLQRCTACNGVVFHDAVTRWVATPHGTRRLVVWSCETHPLPVHGLVIRS